jgi:hypothetical protein
MAADTVGGMRYLVGSKDTPRTQPPILEYVLPGALGSGS